METSDRLRHALELMALGFAMQAQNLRRRNPDWSEREVEEALDRWVMERPIDKGFVRRPS